MSNLQEAFREAARREFAMVPAEEELDYVFSRKFERNMQKIIRAQVYGYWNLVNTAAKRAACIAAIIAMLLTTAMAIKPIRERVIKFFVEVYEEYFEITFGEEVSGDLDPTPQPMTRYTFSWVPEGYTMVNSSEYEALFVKLWKNDEKVITLSQNIGSHEITVDYMGDNIKEIEINNIRITCMRLKEMDTFIWEQHGCVFHLTVPNGFSVEEIMKMIKSFTKE